MGYKKNFFKGTTWLTSYRAATRVFTFVRIAILARLLSPSDFGTFGIALLILSFVEILTQTGINTVLIQHSKQYKKYINDAMFISVFRGILMSIAIIALIPIVERFFNVSNINTIFYLTALVPFIKGFINPAIINLQIDFKYAKEFVINTAIFAIDSIIVVTATVVTQKPESVIYGLIGGALVEVIVSYALIKPKPSLVFKAKNIKFIFSQGKWMTGAGILEFLTRQGDDLVVTKVLSTYSLGLYQAAFRISSAPVSEISDVVGKVTLPLYVKFSDDKKRLKNAYIKVLFVVTALSAPLSLFVYFFPELIIEILLGKQWIGITKTLQILAVYGAVRSISGTTGALFYSLKLQKKVTLISLIRFLGLAVTIVPLTLKYGIEGAATSALISALIAIPISVYYGLKELR